MGLYRKIAYCAALTISITSCQGQPTFMAPPPNSSPTVELAPSGAKDVVSGSYIVMFRSEKADTSRFFSSFFDEYQHHYLSLSEQFISDPRIKDLDILSSENLSLQNDQSGWAADFDPPAAMQFFWQERPDDILPGVLTRVDFKTPEDAQAVLKEWELQGRIWYAEPNGLSKSSADENIWQTYAKNYDSLAATWHKNIDLVAAFNTLAANTQRRPDNDVLANKPIIAILDSGVDYAHPQLQGVIWENDAPGASGCEGDKYGCNTTAPSRGSLGNGEVWPVGASGPGQATDGGGKHGTHVAGIAAANAGSGVGGVCPVCRIMIVKVAAIESGSEGSAPGISDDSQIRGLKYVTRFKSNNSSAVRVVNSSFGKYTRSRSVSILVDSLKRIGNGTLVVAAASNEDSMIRSYPAALANAVAVAALDDDNRKSSFSNFGPWVDVAAPGRSITSTYPGGITGEESGTSMAAPVVAGAAGLYLALNPNVSFNELRSRVTDCADAKIYTADSDAARFNAQNYFPPIEGESVRRPLLGSGIVNVNNMLTGNCKSSVGRPLDRVTPGCSTISGVGSAHPSWFYLFLALPLLSRICFRRLKR